MRCTAHCTCAVSLSAAVGPAGILHRPTAVRKRVCERHRRVSQHPPQPYPMDGRSAVQGVEPGPVEVQEVHQIPKVINQENGLLTGSSFNTQGEVKIPLV